MQFMSANLTFGVEPNMREVPAGQSATFKVGKVEEWQIVETEYGLKYQFPIVLFSHPSYESLPKKGLSMLWQSKAVAARQLFEWMYEEDITSDNNEYVMKVFDHDMSKELNGTYTLIRHDAGGYKIELEI